MAVLWVGVSSSSNRSSCRSSSHSTSSSRSRSSSSSGSGSSSSISSTRRHGKNTKFYSLKKCFKMYSICIHKHIVCNLSFIHYLSDMTCCWGEGKCLVGRSLGLRVYGRECTPDIQLMPANQTQSTDRDTAVPHSRTYRCYYRAGVIDFSSTWHKSG